MATPVQLTMGLDAPHRNRYLFSDHYLNTLLPTDPRWAEALPEATDFLAWLQELNGREQAQLAHYNESQLEEHWFKPILTRLGHVYEPQASLPGLETGIKRPDYVFFADQAARQAAAFSQRSSDYAENALAVGEVKAWQIPLSKKQKGGGASFDAQNPSYQIDYYLRIADLDWGLLSNGRRWRLVHADSSQRLSIYYEVDLIDLLERDDPHPLRYFTLFFRQAAFRPDSQGRHFLNEALQASRRYAVALEEDLQQNVYQALEQLMQGFLDLPANGLGQADLPHIYHSSLYLLYRLLFILYGESRGLLPMANPRYRDHYSLDRLKREFARLASPPAPMTRKYWDDVQELFRIINGDDAALNQYLKVPRYNGGLFDPRQHPFLEEKAVGDQALVAAINLLSRRQTESGMEFVDYRTLGVRQLGSIYEGLLEYQPRYAAESLVAIRDGKGERWLTAEEAPQGATVTARRQPGQIYLETDRGERKATGSYYTPQYIVEYIVEQTLGPLVEAARQQVKERAKQAPGRTAQAQAEQSLVDEVLNLKVLDPAMGSGHFLVEATEFLALALTTDPYVETPDESRPDRSGRPVRSELGEEEDLALWRRRVVERCIYGVDKNPLAVELAKLSLWLATVAADRPLSFIDHHLRCGDALVGAQVADLGWPPPPVLNKKAQKQVEQQKAGQMNMFGYLLSQRLPVVMGKILEITAVESDSYETVQAKEAVDRAVQQLKAPFQAVADLWTAAYFGHSYNPADYDAALDAHALSQPEELLQQPAVAEARRLARKRRFFHWELAFPEVFYDPNGQALGERAGFDAVVGNPPYIRSVRLKDADPQAWAFYATEYQAAAKREFDIYLCFAEKGLLLLNSDGLFGMIMPNKWFTTQVGEALRELLSQRSSVKYIVDFGPFQVFKGVTTYTCLLFLSGSPQTDIKVAILEMANGDTEPLPEIKGNWQTGVLPGSKSLGTEAWNFIVGPAKTLLDKFAQLPQLKNMANVFKGTGTSADQVYLMQHEGERFYSRSLGEWVEIEMHLMRPASTGRDVSPYHYRSGNYLLFPYWASQEDVRLIAPETMETAYPKAWAYLNHPTNQQILMGRDKGAFRNRKDWYGYGRPQNMHLLALKKIVGPDVASRATFACDLEGRYIIDTTMSLS